MFDALGRLDDARILLDSGAFTIWRGGGSISLDEYCKLCADPPIKLWRYFMLDVIGDAAATRRNLHIMLDKGLRPIPIFTRGEDPEWLDELYGYSDIVAIGGLVGTKGRRGFIKGISKYIGDRKVHWLGFGEPNYLSYYRPFSCDSASWSSGVRYGRIDIHEGMRTRQLQKRDFASRPDRAALSYIRAFGIDPHRCAIEAEWRNIEGTVLRQMAYANAITRAFDIEDRFGTLFFNVFAGPHQIRTLIATRQRLLDDGII